MFNLPTLIYSSSAAIMMFLSSVFLYSRIKDYQIHHLKLMCLGLFLQGFLPLAFVPQAFLQGSEYNKLIANFVIIGADLFLVGTLITIWNLKIHQKVRIPKRYILLVLVIGFELAWMVYGTDAIWTKGSWVIQRSLFVRIIMFAGVGWILYEMFRVFILGALNYSSIWAKVALFYPTGISISYILLVFRDELPFPTTFYQIFSAIGASFFIFAIFRDQNILILPNVQLNQVILTDKASGLAALTYPEDSQFYNSMSLTSAALTGISELIKELSGKDHIPPKLGYVDFTISVYPGSQNTMFVISNGEHPLLDGLANQLLNKWDRGVISTHGNISDTDINEFASDINSAMKIFLTN